MGVTIDGKTLNQLGLAMLKEHQHPAAPSTRDYTISIPGMAGAYDFGSDLGVRQFTLPLLVKPQPNENALALKVREIMKTFFDQYGKPRTIKLIFDYEPDKYYNVRYSGSLDMSRFKTMTKIVFPLTAFDPYAYALSSAYDSKNKQNYDTGLKYDNGLMYPNTQNFQWLYSTHYSGVHNYSYYETTLKIIIKGRCKNPKITNLKTGKWIQINETFADADQLIIDTKTWTVVKNGTINLLAKYTGDFIQLVEGDNSFLFESETPPSAQVSFEWNHLFL